MTPGHFEVRAFHRCIQGLDSPTRYHMWLECVASLDLYFAWFSLSHSGYNWLTARSPSMWIFTTKTWPLQYSLKYFTEQILSRFALFAPFLRGLVWTSLNWGHLRRSPVRPQTPLNRYYSQISLTAETGFVWHSVYIISIGSKCNVSLSPGGLFLEVEECMVAKVPSVL